MFSFPRPVPVDRGTTSVSSAASNEWPVRDQSPVTQGVRHPDKTDNRQENSKQLYLKFNPRQGNRVTLLFPWLSCNAKVDPGGEEEMLT